VQKQWCNSRNEKFRTARGDLQPTKRHQEVWIQGHGAELSEMKQLHDQECFKPTNFKDLNKSENSKAIESLLFLVEKRYGRNNARHLLMANHKYNGWTGRTSQVLLSSQNQQESHQ